MTNEDPCEDPWALNGTVSVCSPQNTSAATHWAYQDGADEAHPDLVDWDLPPPP